MELSVMLFPFHRILGEARISGAELVRTFRAEGVGAIEPMLGWTETTPEPWRQFHAAAVDAGMSFSCLDIGVDLVGNSDADRAKALDTVVRGVEFARSLECPLVLLAGSKAAPDLGEPESRRVYGRSLALAAERARGSGVTITIEDFGVYPTFTASAAHCLEVLEVAGPAVRFTFDNGNFLLADDRPTAAYPLVRSRLAHVHIKDFALRPADAQKSLTSPSGRQFKGAPIGQGEAEVTACVNLLKADAYPGWFSLEVGGDPVAEAVHGARFVKALY